MFKQRSMPFRAVNNKLSEWQQKHNQLFNTLGNHLLVVFTFFVPLSFSGRRSTFFVLFTIFLLRGNYVFYIKNAIRDKIVFAFFLYFAIHVIWLLGTDNFEYAKKMIHEAQFLFYPLLFMTFLDKKYIPRLMATFFVAMMISELWSYGIYFEILPPHIHDGDQGVPGDPTPVLHHIHYGFILAITLTFIFQRFFYEKDSPAIRVAMLFFFVTGSANLFITAGRTGYVLYVILIIFLLFRLFRNQFMKAAPIAVLIISAALVLAYNFSDTFKTRIQLTENSLKSIVENNNYNSSIGYRLAVNLYSDKAIKENWLFGAGTGDQLDVMRASIAEYYPQFVNIANDIHHMHNEYTTLLLEFGIIGLLIFLNILYQVVKYDQPDDKTKNMQLILVLAVFFFAFGAILVGGNSALFIFVTLISFTLRKYLVNDAQLIPIDFLQIAKYAVAIIVLELVSWVT